MIERYEILPGNALVSEIRERQFYISNSGHSVAYALADGFLIQFKAGLVNSNLYPYLEEDDKIEYMRYKVTPTINRMTVGQLDARHGLYNYNSSPPPELDNRAYFTTMDEPDAVIKNKPFTYCPAPKFAKKRVTNLSQLKAALKPGVQFRVHQCKNKAFEGTLRTVNIALNDSIYSKVTDDPYHIASICNVGRGSLLPYSKAKCYSFGKTIKCYATPCDKSTLIYEIELQYKEQRS